MSIKKLWEIKEIRKYIIDEEEAKKIAKNSNKKIKVICPECKFKKDVIVSNLTNQGFSCRTCSSGVSYPELFFTAYNNVLNLNFKPQQVFDDFKGYRFDFVDYKNRIIVETHGKAHYDKNHPWHKRSIESDKIKRKYCKDNNWVLIELDCRISDFNFIKSNINKNDLLKNISKDNEINILKIIEKNKRYPIKKIIDMYKDNMSTNDIGKELNVSGRTIRNILKRNNIEIKSRGHKGGDSLKRKVYCITLDKVFNSVKEASDFIGLKGSSGITFACQKKTKSAGKHPVTGEKLTWEYVN